MRRFFKWTLFAALAGALWLTGVAWRIASFGSHDGARPADVAVVLGAAAYHKRPSPVFEARINHALTLYRRGVVKKLLFTGGFGDGAPMAESQVARRFAILAGIPEEDILIETVSRSTKGNVEQAAALMAERDFHSAVLVSDPLHMRRAVSMMEDQGMTVYSSPTPTSRYISTLERAKFLLREVYFYHGYLLAGK